MVHGIRLLRAAGQATKGGPGSWPLARVPSPLCGAFAVLHTVTDLPDSSRPYRSKRSRAGWPSGSASTVAAAAPGDGLNSSCTGAGAASDVVSPQPDEGATSGGRGAAGGSSWSSNSDSDGETVSAGAEAAHRGSTTTGPRDETTASMTVRQAWHRPDLALVLVNPQIPQNSGNAARTCAATGVPLHLVGPLGFELDDRKLKRAGLDYWDAVAVNVHPSWAAFMAFFSQLPQPKRLVAFTVYGDTYYAGPEFAYRPGDWLVFGAETSGLPPHAHADVVASGGCLVKIPIRDTHVRSINLAVAAGVGLFEAVRQLDEQSGSGHTVSPRQSPSLEEVAAAHRDGRPLANKPGRQQ